MVSSSLLENQTWDEATHLVAGYTYLKLGDFRLNWEHPPLAKLLAALPLLAVNPRLPIEHESWRTGDTVMFGAVFLYRNVLPPDRLLLLGRLPIMGLTVILGFLVALWTRKHFGAAAALLAVFFYATDPNVIAHGRYVTTDLIAALLIFVVCIVWARFLTTKAWTDVLATGVLLGLALASKYSALILLVLLPGFYLIRWWQEPRRFSLRHFAATGLIVVLLGTAVLLAVYWPETNQALIERQSAPLSVYMHPSNRIGHFLHAVGKKTDLPAHAYLLGLDTVADHNHRGHPAYLLGEIYEQGRWYYFPVAFAVKTPTGLLLLLILGGVTVLGFLRPGGRLARLRGAGFPWVVAVVASTGYFLFAMASNLNLGLRHILPIYPFLYVVAGVVAARGRPRTVIVMALVLQVYEHARIYPHYLAFFNTFTGGPVNGPRFLVDSNLDWGQDVKKLRRWLDKHDIDEVYISYFGVTDLAYYGVRHQLTEVWNGGSGENLDCVVAISATLLQGLYRDEDYSWFRTREPDARVGYSIYVYDLRKRLLDRTRH